MTLDRYTDQGPGTITTLRHRYRELGRLRTGRDTQNRKRHPAKLDTFRFTSTDWRLIKRVAGLYGGKPETWADAPGWNPEKQTGTRQFQVVVEADRILVSIPAKQQLTQQLEYWTAAGCQRRCNGEAMTSGEECQCAIEMMDGAPRMCAHVTRANFILPNLPGLGVWRLESHGVFTASELPLQMAMAARYGPDVQWWLRLDPRSYRTSDDDGKPVTYHFGVPVLDTDLTPGQLLELEAGGQGVALGAIESNRTTSQQSDPPVPVSPPASGRGGSDLTSERQTAIPDDTQHNGPQYSPEAGSVASGGHVRGARRPGSARSDPTSEGQTRVRAAAESRGGTAAGPRPSDPTSEGEAHGGAESLRDSSLPPSDPTVPAGEQPNAKAAGAPAGTPTSGEEGERVRSGNTQPRERRDDPSSSDPTSEAAFVGEREADASDRTRTAGGINSAASDPSSPPAEKEKLGGRGETSAAGLSTASASTGDVAPAGSPAADQTSGEETADGASISEGPQTPQLLASSPDPKSPTRPVSRQPGRVGGNVEGVPSVPVSQSDGDSRDSRDSEDLISAASLMVAYKLNRNQLCLFLRKEAKEDFGKLTVPDVENLDQDQLRKAEAYLKASRP